MKRPKVRNERFSRLEEDEEDKLLAALDDCRNPYIKPTVILALETGMRRSELLSLKWGDVDLKHAWERARARAGMEHYNLAISRLFELGWGEVKVSSVSGHRSMQCLKRYANFRARDLAKELG